MVFILVTYFVALNQNISEISASSGGAVISMASFGRLIRDTCNACPDNGPWIVFNLCVVQKFHFCSFDAAKLFFVHEG